MRTGAWRTRRRVRLQGAGCRAIAVRSGLAAANGGAGLRVRNYLRHNDVVKYVGQARTASGGAAAAGAGLDAAQTRRTTPTAPGQATPTLSGTERGTRARVARLILENGPATATSLSTRLGLTPAAVRRHLDNLLADGMIESRTARTYGTRGRGRPARLFAITDAGRSAFEHAYDDLATSALRFLAQRAGPAAATDFGRRRGRAALPASLPGGPRSGRVPSALRGRDRGVRPPARHPRPAARDDRERRRRLHNARLGAVAAETSDHPDQP